MTIFYLHHQKRLDSLRKGEYHEQSRAEQSRAEQSRAEQSRAEQSRAEQSRAEQSRAEQKLGDYTQVEKLDLRSKDVLSDNIAKIGQLFPEVLTESSDENGR
ncbi:TPA: hypothetical protein TZC22_000359 [Streptococcus suis]|nr:hypothetical protein [Streptococcus suis]MBS0774411.1 hypothetical protein [Streptococcus suis]MBS0781095.1 hypothetical protein [Streptococcus suis]NQL37069.1 hypothetical protein [Streptococcus suis]NQQ06439.1 hypothetical protein [Streptococcus suis]NQQ90527.1 hypothetical protein [Streptococcus suis]